MGVYSEMGMLMKRFACALLLLLMVMPALIAQDEKPKTENADAVVLMKLYRHEGASWSYRVIHWTRGESPVVETTSDSVTKVNEGKATVEGETCNLAGDVTESRNNEISLDLKTDPLVAAELPLETLDMGFRKFKCRKHQEKAEGLQVTTWTSVEHHPLVVKKVTFRGDYTEIRKLTAFNSGESDPWQLYRMEGRRWKLKTLLNMAGVKQTSYSESTVDSVTADSCDMTTRSLDKDGNELASTTTTVKFKSAAGSGEPASPLVVEDKKCEVGTFSCYKVKLETGTVWSSVRWPGLIVYMDMKSMTQELVEFDLGHDAMKFYRKAGNSYSVRSVTTMAGMKVENTISYTVKKVEHGKCTYEMVSKDANGNKTFSSKLTMDVGDKPDDLLLYSDQVEETIETPAGKFPAIRTEGSDGKTVSWSWNGIVVKTETKMDGITVSMELTELKME
jgi:hypothetical protein